VWDFAMNYSDLWKRYVRLNEVDVSPTPPNPPAGTSPAASPSTNQNQMRTYGDLQKIIQKVDRDKTLKVVGDQVKDALIDQLAGLIPGASNIKDAFGFFKSIYDSKDTQKTNTWLDRLNIDDNYTMIVDDTIENAFLKELSQMIARENPQTQLPTDFNINKKLEDWLKQKYGNRTLAGGIQEGKSKRAKVGKKSGGDRCTRIAKRKYDVWPSAYASGAVVKCRQGKIWKGISENATDEEIDLELLLEESSQLLEKWSDTYKRSIDCKNPKGFSQKAHCQGRKKKVNEIAAYHGSSVDFDQFESEKAREFGFHFGTIESAMHRNSTNVKKYDVSITKPLELDDVGFWEPASILESMVNNSYISEDEKQTLLQQINVEAIRRAKASGSSLRYEKNEILKSKLEEMGYDGIVYENRGEAGDTAYIAFRPEQVKFIEKLDEAKKKAYKPNFSKEKEQGLHGWFARNDGKGWVNCRTGGPCGRDNADSGGKYPACRPTKAQCKSAGKGPLRKKKSSEAISWTKKKKKD